MTFLDTGFFNMLTNSPKNNKVLCDDITRMLSIADEKNDDMGRYTKNIDILRMKCVIIPANVNNNHWVLYVLMNPCSILSALQSNDDKYKEEVDKKDGAPLLLYFDSENNKPLYIRKIYDWIFRLCMKEDGFKDYAEQLKGGKKYRMLRKKILPVINVNRAIQGNEYDCGLFVCRNAYNILTSCLYDLNVSFQDIEDCQNCKGDLVSLVYEKIGKQWNYNQVDIEIFRIELRALYAKMSHVAIEPPNSNIDENTEKKLERKAVEESTKNALKSIETCNIKGNLDKKDAKKSTASMERNSECVDGPDVRKLNDNSSVKPPAENKNDPESQDASFSCMINDKRQSTVMRGFSTRLNPILCNAVGFKNGVDTRDITLNDICTHIDTTVS